MEHDVPAHLLAVPVGALALLILYAGISKLFYLPEFRASLLYVPYLPMKLVPAIAVAVPVVEVIAGACLLPGTRLGMALTCALLLTTSVVAVVSHVRRQRVPCVCFTASGSESLSLATVARNSAFALIALLPLVASEAAFKLDMLVLSNSLALIFIYLSAELVFRNIGAMRDLRRAS